jgi:hypothetical protein
MRRFAHFLLTLSAMLLVGCSIPSSQWSLGGEAWGKHQEEEPKEGEFARKGPGVLVWLQYRY